MFLLSILLAALMVLLVVAQSLGNETYLHWFRNYVDEPVADDALPKMAIVLSLRGADPSLPDCLRRLTNLDYPSYEVHVVIDHETDPAHEAVRQWQRDNAGKTVFVHFLKDISPNAYLKTSAIRQCLLQLDRSIHAAVMVDADTLTFPNWLRELANPLVRKEVGLSTGNRWFDPSKRKWGSRVRFLYNANSIVPMFFLPTTWGGSLAVRRDVFESEYFLDRMWNTFSEESAMQDATTEAGLKMQITPNVMMLNQEEISLRDCFRYVRRQLLWTRLYHPRWAALLAGTIATYLLLAGSAVLGCVLPFLGDGTSASVIGLGILFVIIANIWYVERFHAVIAKRYFEQGRGALPKIDWGMRFRLIAALPVTLLVYTYGAIAAALARKVNWRGITYIISPPKRLKMVEYRPYSPPQRGANSGESIV